MNTDSKALNDLIHACLDGVASEDQMARLNAKLRDDAAARDVYLQLADIHSCLAVDESLWIESPAHTRAHAAHTPAPRQHWFVRHPLAATAAGIVFGMFCTSVLFAYVTPSLVRTKLVFNEDFEVGTSKKTTPGVPRETGKWAGDEAEVVTSSPELKSNSGRKMLRFLSATYPGENSPRSLWGDVYRIVDVQGLVAPGRAVARISASFAQDKPSGDARFSCSVEAIAMDQDLATLPETPTLAWLQQNNSAAGSRKLALSTSGEWREVSAEVPITAQTRFVVLHLAVIQTTPVIHTGVVQFPGQYVDDVKVEILARP
jgi:hypothetical protein